MHFPANDSNPYAVGSVTPNSVSGSASRNLPVYAIVLFIISLVLCLLRVLLVALGLVGYLTMKDMDPPPPEMATVPFEIGTGIAIAFFGILGNGLMLAKRRLGLYFGYLLVLSVVASMAVGFWQGATMFAAFKPGTPEFVAAIVGLVIVVGIRVGLLIAYVMALLSFKKWSDAGG